MEKSLAKTFKNVYTFYYHEANDYKLFFLLLYMQFHIFIDNFGNPAYMLLVGACKSGIEPLVRALLHIPGVGPLLGCPIPGHDGLDVAGLAQQNGHTTIANCIKDLIKQ